ncbi:cytochrome c oxidase subunit 7C, mitochondrial-like [Chrysoperla carnea]|uniref:cytochrome c oxidase subunit 7C, mitochondrial-like n=1 Tax=Chrysoperla carnea TaxID=189513 RepID=UPI001D096073|nr:cytochrome c oxidase subunit 7C, mitochondrial-like [Chrysoperla carnea]XP_044738401.1 cytochrome c oxidase subunit 7C, mitochondrial-like [Chrysoperla carnea]
MLQRVGILSRNALRQTQTIAIRHSHDGGVPGGNLPFGINNVPKLTAYFTIFMALGLGAPFFVLRHQLVKKSSG